MSNSYWLVKQEPSAYPWESFLAERGTAWSGVRNFQARNHLRAMRKGDRVLYYHSGDAKEIVGLAKVAKEAYPDPTATEGDWSAVDLVPLKALRQRVALAAVKADPVLKQMLLARNSRLSVSPVTAEQFARVMELAQTKA